MTPRAPPLWLDAVWRGLRGSGAVELAARVGYASRGAVYLSVGLMALLKALRLTPHAESAIDALQAWAQWPVGVVLLWITGVGLCGFALWRALQSLADVEHLGLGMKALITRVGKATSGLLYGTLGVTVLRLLDTLRDLPEELRVVEVRRGERVAGSGLGDSTAAGSENGISGQGAQAGDVVRRLNPDSPRITLGNLQALADRVVAAGHVDDGGLLRSETAQDLLCGVEDTLGRQRSRRARDRGLGRHLSESSMAIWASS